MKKRTARVLMITGAAAGTSMLAACGGGEESIEDYPSREIEMVIPWDPGGGSDIEGRLVTEHVSNTMDNDFVVVNLPGVGGTVGLEELTEEPADGYSLGQIHEGLLVAHHSDITEINYDSFEPIAAMSSADQILAVSSEMDVDTLEEFVEYGQNEEITFGGTVSGIPRVWVEQMARELEVDYNMVGYEGLAEAIQALAGDHVDAAIVDYPSAESFVGAGDMKFIAIGTAERIERLPDVPTFQEEGYDLTLGLNRGYVAPEGTSEEIIEYLGEQFEETANDPEYIEAVENIGAEVDYMGPADYREHLEEQDSIISDVIEELGDELE
ncbi:Bug family tripartite tricarboxylate transporter substrate binding protein [Alkalicoccus halolimnae]|uniref:Tripartite tricarboxylate transporter substrate binding protein n=1 Tax=Alkalicoccus halolimnae TaxID=1667239 RepID=A0A5C7F4E4_9BACI|nr:tripartite tricarboxylate transporter substrate binding protein [Alkalicoccus halolimnae]TXF85502.1 tripartite tricarboxylate transporter substrate binding protein [Alkalicoccus halolimnae]